MKLVIVNSYVRENGGDAAILSVHLRQLLAEYPGAEITIASIEDPKIQTSYEGAKNIGSMRRYVGVEEVAFFERIGRKIFSLLVALFCFRGPGRLKKLFLGHFTPPEIKAELRAIYEADLVVCVGGGHLNASKGLGGDLNVFYLTLPIILAERLGRPVVYGPQSFGPFWGRLQHRLVFKALSGAELVMVREEISYKLLKKLGIKASRLLLTADAGFDFTAKKKLDVRKLYRLPKNTKVVAITMRAWFSGQRREELEKSFAAFIDHLHAKKYEVLLVPQVTTHYRADDDRIAEARIADYCGPKKPILVSEVADATRLKALYEDVDIVIGTRFHSVIFALTSNVPCMAVEYDHKTTGIMQSLGLGEWVITLDDVTAKDLIRMFDALEKNTTSYLRKVRAAVPAKITEASKIGSRLRQAFESGKKRR